ncbi:TetR/AcrR family transcriptional regulator [Nocardia sp. CA-128927]|uniref:TetR/AcrR family transcriptional regulator n=1 Tax=Nocardia sp. CA-128927 TaxID=3239975 RepID=UPI003D9856FB
MAPQSQQVDGRRARGQQRQELLLATVLELVRQRGLAELTIRNLATAAGVSLASITYHFPTRPELVLATCVEAMRQDLAMARRAVQELRTATDLRTIPIDQLAEWLLRLSSGQEGPAMPLLSFYLEIARQPALAAVATQWMDEIREVIADVLAELGADEPASGAVLLHSTLAGLRLPLLARPDLDVVQTHSAGLARLLHWIIGR